MTSLYWDAPGFHGCHPLPYVVANSLKPGDGKAYMHLLPGNSFQAIACCPFGTNNHYPKQWLWFIVIYLHSNSTFENVVCKMEIIALKLWCVNSSHLYKMATISQTTFWNAFSWMKMFVFCFKFHWSLFLRVQLTIFQHWFRYWLGADQATSHYLSQWWPSSLTYICSTRGRWVNYPESFIVITMTALNHMWYIHPKFISYISWATFGMVTVIIFSKKWPYYCDELSV